MDNYSGLLPFLWKTFKTKPHERKMAPDRQPLSMPRRMTTVEETDQDGHIPYQDEELHFLNSEVVSKSPSRFAKSPSRFAKSPGMMFGRTSSPGRTHKRRHSTGLSGFSLPSMLSSKSQRAH